MSQKYSRGRPSSSSIRGRASQHEVRPSPKGKEWWRNLQKNDTNYEYGKSNVKVIFRSDSSRDNSSERDEDEFTANQTNCAESDSDEDCIVLDKSPCSSKIESKSTVSTIEQPDLVKTQLFNETSNRNENKRNKAETKSSMVTLSSFLEYSNQKKQGKQVCQYSAVKKLKNQTRNLKSPHSSPTQNGCTSDSTSDIGFVCLEKEKSRVTAMDISSTASSSNDEEYVITLSSDEEDYTFTSSNPLSEEAAVVSQPDNSKNVTPDSDLTDPVSTISETESETLSPDSDLNITDNEHNPKAVSESSNNSRLPHERKDQEDSKCNKEGYGKGISSNILDNFSIRINDSSDDSAEEDRMTPTMKTTHLKPPLRQNSTFLNVEEHSKKLRTRGISSSLPYVSHYKNQRARRNIGSNKSGSGIDKSMSNCKKPRLEDSSSSDDDVPVLKLKPKQPAMIKKNHTLSSDTKISEVEENVKFTQISESKKICLVSETFENTQTQDSKSKLENSVNSCAKSSPTLKNSNSSKNCISMPHANVSNQQSSSSKQVLEGSSITTEDDWEIFILPEENAEKSDDSFINFDSIQKSSVNAMEKSSAKCGKTEQLQSTSKSPGYVGSTQAFDPQLTSLDSSDDLTQALFTVSDSESETMNEDSDTMDIFHEDTISFTDNKPIKSVGSKQTSVNTSELEEDQSQESQCLLDLPDSLIKITKPQPILDKTPSDHVKCKMVSNSEHGIFTDVSASCNAMINSKLSGEEITSTSQKDDNLSQQHDFTNHSKDSGVWKEHQKDVSTKNTVSHLGSVDNHPRKINTASQLNVIHAEIKKNSSVNCDKEAMFRDYVLSPNEPSLDVKKSSAGHLSTSHNDLHFTKSDYIRCNIKENQSHLQEKKVIDTANTLKSKSETQDMPSVMADTSAKTDGLSRISHSTTATHESSPQMNITREVPKSKFSSNDTVSGNSSNADLFDDFQIPTLKVSSKRKRLSDVVPERESETSLQDTTDIKQDRHSLLSSGEVTDDHTSNTSTSRHKRIKLAGETEDLKPSTYQPDTREDHISRQDETVKGMLDLDKKNENENIVVKEEPEFLKNFGYTQEDDCIFIDDSDDDLLCSVSQSLVEESDSSSEDDTGRTTLESTKEIDDLNYFDSDDDILLLEDYEDEDSVHIKQTEAFGIRLSGSMISEDLIKTEKKEMSDDDDYNLYNCATQIESDCYNQSTQIIKPELQPYKKSEMTTHSTKCHALPSATELQSIDTAYDICTQVDDLNKLGNNSVTNKDHNRARSSEQTKSSPEHVDDARKTIEEMYNTQTQSVEYLPSSSPNRDVYNELTQVDKNLSRGKDIKEKKITSRRKESDDEECDSAYNALTQVSNVASLSHQTVHNKYSNSENNEVYNIATQVQQLTCEKDLHTNNRDAVSPEQPASTKQKLVNITKSSTSILKHVSPLKKTLKSVSFLDDTDDEKDITTKGRHTGRSLLSDDTSSDESSYSMLTQVDNHSNVDAYGILTQVDEPCKSNNALTVKNTASVDSVYGALTQVEASGEFTDSDDDEYMVLTQIDDSSDHYLCASEDSDSDSFENKNILNEQPLFNKSQSVVAPLPIAEDRDVTLQENKTIPDVINNNRSELKKNKVSPSFVNKLKRFSSKVFIKQSSNADTSPSVEASIDDDEMDRIDEQKKITNKQQEKIPMFTKPFSERKTLFTEPQRRKSKEEISKKFTLSKSSFYSSKSPEGLKATPLFKVPEVGGGSDDSSGWHSKKSATSHKISMNKPSIVKSVRQTKNKKDDPNDLALKMAEARYRMSKRSNKKISDPSIPTASKNKLIQKEDRIEDVEMPCTQQIMELGIPVISSHLVNKNTMSSVKSVIEEPSSHSNNSGVVTSEIPNSTSSDLQTDTVSSSISEKLKGLSSEKNSKDSRNSHTSDKEHLTVSAGTSESASKNSSEDSDKCQFDDLPKLESTKHSKKSSGKDGQGKHSKDRSKVSKSDVGNDLRKSYDKSKDMGHSKTSKNHSESSDKGHSSKKRDNSSHDKNKHSRSESHSSSKHKHSSDSRTKNSDSHHYSSKSSANPKEKNTGNEDIVKKDKIASKDDKIHTGTTAFDDALNSTSEKSNTVAANTKKSEKAGSSVLISQPNSDPSRPELQPCSKKAIEDATLHYPTKDTNHSSKKPECFSKGKDGDRAPKRKEDNDSNVLEKTKPSEVHSKSTSKRQSTSAVDLINKLLPVPPPAAASNKSTTSDKSDKPSTLSLMKKGHNTENIAPNEKARVPFMEISRQQPVNSRLKEQVKNSLAKAIKPLGETQCKSSLMMKEPGRLLQENDFLERILTWNPVWLDEQEKCSRTPPIYGEGAARPFPLLERYESYDDYQGIFMPLLLLETWAQVTKDYNDKKITGRRVKCLACVEKVEKCSNRLVMYCWRGVLTSTQIARQLYPMENDLVYLHTVGKVTTPAGTSEEKPWPQMGFVERMILKEARHADHIIKALPLLKKDPALKERNSSVFTAFIKVRHRALVPDTSKQMFIEPISPIVTNMRQFHALALLPRSPLYPHILKPSDTGGVYVDKPASLDASLKEHYNDSQVEAICSTSYIAQIPKNLPRIQLIQGPPGTGKSHTIVGVIESIFKVAARNRTQPLIVLCAPSNAAVDELMKRMVRRKREQGIFTSLRIVRAGGTMKTIDPAVFPFSLNELVKKNLDKKLNQEKLACMPASVRGEMETIIKRINQGCKDRDMAQQAGNLDKARRIISDLVGLRKNKQTIEKSFENRTQNITVSRSDEGTMRLNILKNANVIGSTLNNMGSNLMLQAKLSIDCLIVDEASQAAELDNLIPLQHKVTKLVLVGDPEQLQPTIISKEASEMKFGQSLFERLYNYFNDQPTTPVKLLNIQYRMLPEICHFPSKHVYNGRIKTDGSVVHKLGGCPLVPYLVFDIKDSREECHPSGSVMNRIEAEFTVNLCLNILQKARMQEGHIGIIAPYQQQKSLILEKLRNSRCQQIEVSTVDGFQGREKQVIIMTCVRAGSNQGSIGFMANRKRMNVALTRGKTAMYIVGHLFSLKSDADWKALIMDAEQRRCVVRVNSMSVSEQHNYIQLCLKKFNNTYIER